jgi:hypothetical protein
MRNIFEQTRFRQNNLYVEKSLVLGTLNGGDREIFGSDSVITLTPDDSESVLNMIPAGTKVVTLGANVNGVTDFTVLPPLANVKVGDTIKIIAGSANSELRTPATSAEEINSEDCDGTKELLLTATNIYELTKISTAIGWQCRSFTAVGTVVASVTPD